MSQKIVSLPCILIFINFISLISLNIYSVNKSYENIFVLPIVFISTTILFYDIFEKYANSLVFKLVLIQVIVRYTFLPILICRGDLLTTGNETIYGDYAIFIMSLELLVVFIAFKFLADSQYITYLNKSSINQILPFNLSFITIILLMFLYVYESGFFYLVNYVWEIVTFNETKDDLQQSTGYGAIVFITARIFLTLFLFSYVFKLNIKKKIKVLLLLMIILINSLIIVGTSRFGIVLVLLPLLSIVSQTYSDFKKSILIGVLLFAIPILLIASIQKFSTKDSIVDSDTLFSGNSINMYFSGVGNVSRGIEIFYSKADSRNFDYFINDLMQNIPILSKVSLDEFKSNFIFNESIYGHTYFQDQIVPISLSGLMHFNIVGIIVYPVIFICAALFFERKSYRESFIGYKYAFIALSINLSLIFMQNVSMLATSIVTFLIFIYLPFYLIQKIFKVNDCNFC